MCEEPPLAIDRILISQFENESSRVLILQIARRRNIDRLSQVFFIIMVLNAKILYFNVIIFQKCTTNLIYDVECTSIQTAHALPGA